MSERLTLYELVKKEARKKERPLKIVCDWDECLKPLNPWVCWKIAKNRSLNDGLNFKEFFLEYWCCLKKNRGPNGSKGGPDELQESKGTKIEKFGKWRTDNNRTFINDYTVIKKRLDFQKTNPYLSVAEDLLKCLKEDLISELVLTSNWHMKLRDAELFHPVHGDERKINQHNLTFGLFPNTQIQLVKTSPDKSGPCRWEWIKDNHSDFDIFVDDSSTYIERTRQLFPEKVYAIPDYKCTEYLQNPKVYHVKQEVSDIKDEDFAKAAEEYKQKQADKLTSRTSSTPVSERESIWNKPHIYLAFAGGVGIALLGMGIYWLLNQKASAKSK